MTVGRLRQILDRFDRVRVLVIGDFFLDKYLMVDAGLTERSIETGLPAYQVVEKRVWPGGAGAVAANLRALGAGTVQALGLVGRDGEGYELRTSLEALGVHSCGQKEESPQAGVARGRGRARDEPPRYPEPPAVPAGRGAARSDLAAQERRCRRCGRRGRPGAGA